ncbi:MAG: ribulose-phosphate 3-epimerase, partial [Candidatus Omnitrophota bacterium]
IMDGHFVPNITIGPGVVKNIRKASKLPFDVHLMIKNPFNWVDKFIAAGADMITLHIETINPLVYRRKAQALKSKGIRLGLSLNPGTPLARIKGLLDVADFILVMTVNPGFGGQKFITEVLTKISRLRKIYKGDIAVDGGINNITAKQAVGAGANVLSSGEYIFKSTHTKDAIRRIRCQG